MSQSIILSTSFFLIVVIVAVAYYIKTHQSTKSKPTAEEELNHAPTPGPAPASSTLTLTPVPAPASLTPGPALASLTPGPTPASSTPGPGPTPALSTPESTVVQCTDDSGKKYAVGEEYSLQNTGCGTRADDGYTGSKTMYRKCQTDGTFATVYGECNVNKCYDTDNNKTRNYNDTWNVTIPAETCTTSDNHQGKRTQKVMKCNADGTISSSLGDCAAITCNVSGMSGSKTLYVGEESVVGGGPCGDQLNDIGGVGRQLGYMSTTAKCQTDGTVVNTTTPCNPVGCRDTDNNLFRKFGDKWDVKLTTPQKGCTSSDGLPGQINKNIMTCNTDGTISSAQGSCDTILCEDPTGNKNHVGAEWAYNAGPCNLTDGRTGNATTYVSCQSDGTTKTVSSTCIPTTCYDSNKVLRKAGESWTAPASGTCTTTDNHVGQKLQTFTCNAGGTISSTTGACQAITCNVPGTNMTLYVGQESVLGSGPCGDRLNDIGGMGQYLGIGTNTGKCQADGTIVVTNSCNPTGCRDTDNNLFRNFGDTWTAPGPTKSCTTTDGHVGKITQKIMKCNTDGTTSSVGDGACTAITCNVSGMSGSKTLYVGEESVVGGGPCGDRLNDIGGVGRQLGYMSTTAKCQTDGTVVNTTTPCNPVGCRDTDNNLFRKFGDTWTVPGPTKTCTTTDGHAGKITQKVVKCNTDGTISSVGDGACTAITCNVSGMGGTKTIYVGEESVVGGGPCGDRLNDINGVGQYLGTGRDTGKCQADGTVVVTNSCNPVGCRDTDNNLFRKFGDKWDVKLTTPQKGCTSSDGLPGQINKKIMACNPDGTISSAQGSCDTILCEDPTGNKNHVGAEWAYNAGPCNLTDGRTGNATTYVSCQSDGTTKTISSTCVPTTCYDSNRVLRKAGESWTAPASGTCTTIDNHVGSKLQTFTCNAGGTISSTTGACTPITCNDGGKTLYVGEEWSPTGGPCGFFYDAQGHAQYTGTQGVFNKCQADGTVLSTTGPCKPSGCRDVDNNLFRNFGDTWTAPGPTKSCTTTDGHVGKITQKVMKCNTDGTISSVGDGSCTLITCTASGMGGSKTLYVGEESVVGGGPCGDQLNDIGGVGRYLGYMSTTAKCQTDGTVVNTTTPCNPVGCRDTSNNLFRQFNDTWFDSSGQKLMKCNTDGTVSVLNAFTSPLYGVGLDKKVYFKSNLTSAWTVAGDATDVVDLDAMPYNTYLGYMYLAVKSDKTLYVAMSINNKLVNWQPYLSNTCCVQGIKYMKDGTLLGVGTDNQVYTRNSDSSGIWQLIPNSCCVKSVEVMADGTILGVGLDNQIYKKNSLSDTWTHIPDSGDILDVKAFPDGSLLGVATDNKLWYRSTLTDGWHRAPIDTCCVTKIA